MGGGASAPFKYDEQLLSDKQLQSVVIEGSGTSDCSEIRRAIGHKEQLRGPPTRDNGDPYLSIWDVFSGSVAKFASNEYFGTRVFDDANKGAFKWQTYQEVHDQALAVGAALKDRGHSKHENIGLFATNRAEWMIAALGIYSQDMRTVALYPTLGADAVEYITNFADITTIFVSKKNLPMLIKLLEKMEKVKTIIQFDVDVKRYGNVNETVDDEDVQVCKEKGVELLKFTELLQNASPDVFATNATLDSISHIMWVFFFKSIGIIA